jgi:hypothetical protein
LADQAFDQGGGQSFLPCPEMVCPCGFGLSPLPPLPGGAGLGCKAYQPHRIWSLRDWYVRNLEKIEPKPRVVLFLAHTGKIRLEKWTGWEILLDQRGLKTHFGTAAAKGAA